VSVSERLIAARDAVEEFTQLSEASGLVDELLDAYAHELAEKIRARFGDLYGSPKAPRPESWTGEDYGLLDAADLIDPQAGE
jgi:hypothetical protein